MSVLDQVASTVKSAVTEKASPTSAIVGFITEYLQRPDVGGLPGMVKKFESLGFGPQIQSWIGTGKQLPVAPADIAKVFGNTEISQLATKIGIPPEQVTQLLSEFVPQTINHLTPAGNVPSANKFTELLGTVKQKLGL